MQMCLRQHFEACIFDPCFWSTAQSQNHTEGFKILGNPSLTSKGKTLRLGSMICGHALHHMPSLDQARYKFFDRTQLEHTNRRPHVHCVIWQGCLQLFFEPKVRRVGWIRHQWQQHTVYLIHIAVRVVTNTIVARYYAQLVLHFGQVWLAQYQDVTSTSGCSPSFQTAWKWPS